MHLGPGRALRVLDLLCLALNELTLRPAADPDLITEARILRDAAMPLHDMMEHGEGRIELRYSDGRLFLHVDTPNHRALERMV